MVRAKGKTRPYPKKLSEGSKVVVRSAGSDTDKPAEASVRPAEGRS